MNARLQQQLGELEAEELGRIIAAYDEYIQDANDENRFAEGWRPCCVAEFIDNEWPEMATGH